MPFEYTDENLIQLNKYISPERLAAFHDMARGRHRLLPYKLYEKNTEMSEALYGVVQALEITLRNAVHNTFTANLKTSDWFDIPPLGDKEKYAIADARISVRSRSTNITPGKLVAELTFGFWTKLMGGIYEKTLWVPHLRHIWPTHLHAKRNMVYDRLKNLKTLRNRIAHHERIIGKRELKKDYTDLLETIGWISPEVRLWVENTNCFSERYAKKLEILKATPPTVIAASAAALKK